MVEPNTRVCPRCGEPAGEGELCARCGANLAAMRDMLPTRAEWDAAGHETEAAPRRWLPSWATGSTRGQVIASVAVIALFAVVLIVGTGGNGSHPRPNGGSTSATGASTGGASTGGASTGGASTRSSSTGAATTSTPTATTGNSTVAACAAAWNGGRSAEHRHDLARAVGHAANPVAVLGAYVGAARQVARSGGGNPVLVNARSCVVAADNLVFVQQPDGTWGLTEATTTRFSNIARDPTWTADHANAAVNVGSGAAEGTLSPTRGPLVFLTSAQLGG